MSLTRTRVVAAVILLLSALPAFPVGARAEEPGPPPALDIGARPPEGGTAVAAPGEGVPGTPETRGPVPSPAMDNAAAAPAAPAAPGESAAETPGGPVPPGELEETPPATIADPLEPVNRVMFVFNDKAYFWVMKPVAQGYRAVVPRGARVSVRNFFSNLETPVRFANNLLQGKFKGAGTELLRLVINSTIGMAGFFDPARTGFHLDKRDEDLGQTLGRYGLGQGFYIVWPLVGPSTARDTVGRAGDYFADPLSYIRDPWVETGVRTYKTENGLSLTIGDYEDLKKSSLDPYAAVRDAYIQNRANRVRE